MAKIWTLALSLLLENILTAQAASAATASRCGKQNECVCIDFSLDGGSYIEVRCPSVGGWVPGDTYSGEPADIIDQTGSYQGNGRLLDIIPRAQELPPSLNNYLGSIKPTSKTKLTYDKDCKNLFEQSPVDKVSNLSGLEIFNKIDFRYGENFTMSDGFRPCSIGATAFVDPNRMHEPQVFLCDKFFGQPKEAAAGILIHEAMHIAGQGENSSSGGADPWKDPHSYAIRQVVASACDLPMPVD